MFTKNQNQEPKTKTEKDNDYTGSALTVKEPGHHCYHAHLYLY